MSNQAFAAAPATRRTFLTTAITAASYQRILGANSRIQVGFIGYGLIGKRHVTDFKTMQDVDCAALCDVYKPRLEAGLAQCGPQAKGYGDFRKMLDNKDLQGIVVGTPDHWHTLLTVLACAAGKDVYVEKPLTLFVREGRWIVNAARKYRRVVTVGTQRKHSPEVQAGRDRVSSGLLGKVHTVRAAAIRNIYPGFGKTPPADPPAGFDYDMWLGPAPKTPYTRHRSLYHFRWFWDYSGGQMTNLAAHDINKVHYVMGANAPTQVYSAGGRYALEDDCETPDLQDTVFTYPGFTMLYSVREANAWPDITGIRFLGTKGDILLSEGGYEVIPEMKGDPINQIPGWSGHPPGGPVGSNTQPAPWIQAAKDRPKTDDVMLVNKRNWLDCIRTRKQPFADAEDGHRVATACHLANLSLRLGRMLRWDPVKEDIIGDREASAMLVRPYRKPWDDVLASLKVT
jgi:predicted dehydrogenase